MVHTYSHYIDNQYVAGTSGRFADGYNPALGEVVSKIPLATPEEVNKAVESAKAAFPGWRDTSPIRRARVMFEFRELIYKNEAKIIELISTEHGKTAEDARGEMIRGLEIVEYATGIPQLLKGDFTENVGSAIDAYSVHQPLGVCAAITPFNFPVMVPLWMLIMGIACGNCVVLKPSERDPGSTLFLAELLKEAGLPDGVLNVINGDKEAVDTLLDHPDIASISFVGSTPIAEYVYKRGTDSGKRVQALGGAKNHMIIMPDADLDMAADALIGAAYGSAGERCMAISVAVAVGNIADELVAKLEERVKKVVVGEAKNPKADLGPLITQQHLEKVTGYVESGVAEGADLKVDGRGLKVEGYENGYFIGPCLFDKVTPEMTIYKEEIFGPVLSVVRVDDYDSAAKIINEHEFGNGTSIFTRDGDAARTFANQIQVGMVGINVPIPVPVAYHTFGGWKRSIFGYSGMNGEDAVAFFTKRKTITSRWPTGIRAGAEFVMPTLK